MEALFRSRKFWVLIVDTVVSLLVFFVGKYAPIAAEDVNIVIAALQPVFIMVIGAIAYEDGAALKAGVHPSSFITKEDFE
jgi:hypothetical protein